MSHHQTPTISSPTGSLGIWPTHPVWCLACTRRSAIMGTKTNDFVAPNTRGWHTLTDDGWKPLQPSATLQLPPSFGTHQFTGIIAGWNYEFQLTDGQGIQKNVDTMKERDVKWFGSPSPTTDSSSSNPDSNEALFLRELELKEVELNEERRLRREAEAMALRLRTELEGLRAQLRPTQPPLALEDAETHEV